MVPALALAALLRWYGFSWWSVALAGSGLFWVIGFYARFWSQTTRRRFYIGGALLFFAPLLARLVVVQGSDQAALIELPRGHGSRVLTRLYPESDGALAAAWFLSATHGMRDPEVDSFAEILKQAYARATPSAVSLPTPAITTYLGLQSPTAFDTIVIPPPLSVAPKAAVVFLHGYAGNFYVYCWEFAQAAAAANLVTFCPSMDSSGMWWTPRGRRTLEATLDYAEARGFVRIYLAGLSNGAAGASVLASAFQQKLSGVVLISGVRAEHAASLPTLVVQGVTDQMMPARFSRAYAQRNPNVRYRELAGGHLVFLSRHETVRPIIAEFLTELETKAATGVPRL